MQIDIGRPQHRCWLPGMAPVLALLLANVLAQVTAQEASCPAGKASDGSGCLAAPGSDAENVSACVGLGFDPARLSCETCHALRKRLEEKGGISFGLVDECLGCCQEPVAVERFTVARLIADASSQEKDQDLHDFIKRKAPLFPGLEVLYQEGATAAIELEQEGEPDRIVRADVSGWKSDHLFTFLDTRFQKKEGTAETATKGAWTAEIQSCSGWRLNQLPEVRRFIKEPGHADTYFGLKVNFIPHHNPDLVFFNEHGEEKERLDLGHYNTEQIHDLMQAKGFKRKSARIYKGEIRTCSGWRLNQLPEVRKFVLGRGNADSYVGLRLNFIPHHSPVLVLYDETGKEETQEIDIADYSFLDLKKLMEEHGFKRKEVL